MINLEIDKKYNIIYADPPWNSNKQFARDKNKGNKQHYPLMNTNEIMNMNVSEISSNNCVLFLWCVDSQLKDAMEVMSSWGFSYKTIAFTWIKSTSTNKDFFGVGMWTRKNPEICLLGTKGSPKRINASVRQLQRHKIREHSRKPDEIRDQIVTLCGDLPRIELFARNRHDGWDSWGNEV